jgi:Zn-dependent M16 (insulinase) family peptidase
MIHFEFTLEDAEAEFMLSLFQHDINKLNMDIMDAMCDNEYTEETKQWFEKAKMFNNLVKQKVLENQTYINTDK